MYFSQITIIIKQIKSSIGRSLCIQCSSLQLTEQKNSTEDSKWAKSLLAGKHLNLGGRETGSEALLGGGQDRVVPGM